MFYGCGFLCSPKQKEMINAPIAIYTKQVKS
jgi:hypothetical protein